MRQFILIGAATSAAVAFTGTLQDLRDKIESEDLDHVLAVEVDDVTRYDLPVDVPTGQDESLFLIELLANSAATHLDVAGVQRDAGGHVIDATPGSYDAAKTGMVHDTGAGTVRNTNSPEPTHSLVVEAAVEKDPELPEQKAPTENPAEARGTGEE